MIKCKICQKEFKSQITNSHLKTHGTTTLEYKKRYGEDSLSSVQYRRAKSQKSLGKNNPNYGKTHSEETRRKISEAHTGKFKGVKRDFSEEHIANLRKGIRRREEKYSSGEMERYSPVHNEETKKKISQSISEYAQENPEEMKRRALLAAQTRVKNGNNVSSMKGKKHTEEAKRKISISSKKQAKIKRQLTNETILEKIDNLGFVLRNDIENWVLHLTCQKCQTDFEFTKQYFRDSKIHDKLCPGCYPRSVARSKAEKELYRFVKSLCPDTKHSDRQVISPLEIDILIPSLNIGFEYSGLYWHSQTLNEKAGRDVKFDRYKQQRAKEKGIDLYVILEDEWLSKKEIVKSRIKNILSSGDQARIYARSCEVKQIRSKEANTFLNENHLQGSGRSNVRYGLYYNDELVSVMTFSNSNVSRKLSGWEINRFCSKVGYSIVGGASRLFKAFVKEENPKQVISYADSRWSNGDLYQQLGFEFDSQTPPNYWYFRPNELKRIHRFSLRKNKNDDPNLTEYENRLKQGYLRIWDCGSSKWVWKNLDF